MQRITWYRRVVTVGGQWRAPIRQIPRVAAAAFFALLCVMTAPALAQSEPAQSRGLDWLQSQSLPTAVLTPNPVLSPPQVQTRSEVIQTLIAAGRSVPPALLTSLQALPSAEAEPVARKTVALRAAGIDVATLQAQLIALQASDGSVAAHAAAGATVLDTAWTLRVLSGDAVLARAHRARHLGQRQ